MEGRCLFIYLLLHYIKRLFGMRMKLYHVTPINNLNSILENGLLLDQPKTSLESDTLGVYLSDDWKELLLSDTYPEINHHLDIAVFEIDCSDLDLIDDPEYDKTYWDDELDNLDIKVSQQTIEPSRVKLIGTLHLKEHPRYFSTKLIKDSFKPTTD